MSAAETKGLIAQAVQRLVEDVPAIGRLKLVLRLELAARGGDAPIWRVEVPGPKIDKNHFFFVTSSPSGRFGMEIQGDFQATRGMIFPLDGSAKPRALKGAHDLHNASVGPDDGGRFAWEAKLDTLRIDGPEGVRDHRRGGTPLGFDTQGRVLLFQQPPLVKPHRPGTMMPPAKGTLDEQKCSLLRHVP